MQIDKPEGYPAAFGWWGLMPNGKWQLFATEAEYVEAFEEALKAED